MVVSHNEGVEVTMAARKKVSPNMRRLNRLKTYPLYVDVSPDLFTRLTRYRFSLSKPITRQKLINKAIEEYLKKRGA